MAIIPFFSQYPYTNLEQLNIDGLIRELGVLHGEIQDETTAREAADQAEAAAREAADQVLDDKITAEAETRYHDINELIGDLNTEVSTRISEITRVEGLITEDITRVEGLISAEAETRYHDINELIIADQTMNNEIEALKTITLHVSSDGHGGWDVASGEANDVIKAVDPDYNVVVIFGPANITMERTSILESGNVKTAYFDYFDVPSGGIQFASLDAQSVMISHDSSDDSHSITLGGISIKDYTRIEISMTSDNNVPDSSANITTTNYSALSECDDLRYEYYLKLALPNTNMMVYKRIGVNYSNINAMDIYLNVSVLFMNDLNHLITVAIDKSSDPLDPDTWTYTITGEVTT